MTRKTGTKQKPQNSPLYICTTLRVGSKAVQKYSSHTKRRVLYFVRSEIEKNRQFRGGSCTVTYLGNKKLSNTFSFTNYKELCNRLNACTEQQLLDYLSRGVSNDIV